MTKEEHHNAFERFVNAFLVPDYPELAALGGKHDRGMDARIIDDAAGKVVLVVQSCVSPATSARRKILRTVAALKAHGNIPQTLVYCTSAVIKLELDETRNELRRDENVALVVCDAGWFVQRESFPAGRSIVSQEYSQAVLQPLLQQFDPNVLYSTVLSEEEERIAIQYLEAQSYDRARGGNVTKGIFDALIAYALRDSVPLVSGVPSATILKRIQDLFPAGHHERIAQIVPGRIEKLVNQKKIHPDQQAGGYVLSNVLRESVRLNANRAKERELAFHAALHEAVIATVADRQIEYEYDSDKLIRTAHNCLLWFMREQGKRLIDPYSAALNVIDAERLVSLFLEEHPLPPDDLRMNATVAMDILPHALYQTLKSGRAEISQYLRDKADLFITHAFLQVSPDVQAACQKLLAHDCLYLDTTILIRCIAELFSEDPVKPLTKTLRRAHDLGITLRTWRPYIDELVSHLKGPVLLEWQNHLKDLPESALVPSLRAAPTLIGVFCKHARNCGGSIESIVAEIVGRCNEAVNTIEYLQEELLVTTEDIPRADGPSEQASYQRIFGVWLEGKHRKMLSESRFELLVRNDVNAYLGIMNRRLNAKDSGTNYGHKIWLLTMDRMAWRMPHLLDETDHLYSVAMSLDYLVNYVATLAHTVSAAIPDDALPATSILDESAQIPSELRSIFVEAWQKGGQRPYLRERCVRDLVHDLKASSPAGDAAIASTEKVELLVDESI